MNTMIKVGDQAPDFKLPDQDGNEVTLSDFKGKKVLLSWHPLAWTSVCTDQMRDLDRTYDRFLEKNTIPIGISVDPQPGKSAWAKFLCLGELLILSDFNPLGDVSDAYGLFTESMGASKRANVLIDEKGKVLWVKKYAIPELPDIEEVLRQL